MQVNNIRWIVVVSIIFLMTACVEKYWPELNTDNGQFLVVDGRISNLAGPYTVKLSYSSSTLDTLYIPVSSARITVHDDQGNIAEFIEANPGIYKSIDLQGIVGSSYKINIRLDNGEVYESDFEKILNPIEVDDLIHIQEWQYAQNVLEEDQEGFNFYVKTKGESSSNTYFYWEIEETFEYHSEYRILYIHYGTIESEGSLNNYGIEPMKNIDSLYYCWKTQELNENLIYSIEKLNAQESHQIPLHFIPFGDERLRFGYNMLLKQYVISEKEYTFLNEIKKQNENQGSLFTAQPFQIRGNILNVDDPSELVLGYFRVESGVIGPRIQVRAPWRRYKNEICYADSSMSSIESRINNATEEELPIYFTNFPFPHPLYPSVFVYLFAYVAPYCLDCTTHGGTIIEPDFWQEWYKNEKISETPIKLEYE